MTVTLTHNIDKIINRLSTYERVDVPRAARRTVSQLGYDLAQKDIPQYMEAVFNQPVAFTLKSLRHPTGYKVVSDFAVQLNIRENVGKGNDPARYLYPVTKRLPGNKAYQTKFSRFIRKANVAQRYPIPFRKNLRKNSRGKVMASEYGKVFAGLKRTGGGGKTGRGFRYFSNPDNRGRSRITTRQGSIFDLPEGIYRVKGRSNYPQLLFTYSKRQPTVPKIFDYYGFVEKNIRFKIGPMLAQNLR